MVVAVNTKGKNMSSRRHPSKANFRVNCTVQKAGFSAKNSTHAPVRVVI